MTRCRVELLLEVVDLVAIDDQHAPLLDAVAVRLEHIERFNVEGRLLAEDVDASFALLALLILRGDTNMRFAHDIHVADLDDGLHVPEPGTVFHGGVLAVGNSWIAASILE